MHPRQVVAIALLSAVSAYAADRSRAVRAEFMLANPCPATGKTSGACPGWQADHRTPLCIGGADDPSNLQWMTVADHKRKTRSDVRLCRLKSP